MKPGLQILLILQDNDNDKACAEWEWQGWQGGEWGAGPMILPVCPPLGLPEAEHGTPGRAGRPTRLSSLLHSVASWAPACPHARHGPGLPLVLLASPCPGHMCPASHWLWKEPLLWRPLLTATAHLVCVTLHAHAVFKQFTCFNQRNPPQLCGISTSSWPYREGA